MWPDKSYYKAYESFEDAFFIFLLEAQQIDAQGVLTLTPNDITLNSQKQSEKSSTPGDIKSDSVRSSLLSLVTDATCFLKTQVWSC